MKLLMAMPVYGRHELTKIVLDYYCSLKEKYNLELLAVGSEWDASRSLCEQSGWDYMEYPNSPLSQKTNALVLEAKKYNTDGIIMIGSDDLISECIIKYYQDNFNADTNQMVGFKGCYIYDVSQKKMLHAKGYTGRLGDKTIGAGRFLSRIILDKINWMPWNEIQIDKGLDSVVSNTVSLKGIKEKQLTFEQTGGIIVDIKYSNNITDFSRIKTNYDVVSSRILYEYFPVQCRQIENLPRIKKEYISPSAIIPPNAVIGKGNVIEDFVIIKENVIIGDNNFIGAGTIIGAAAEIKGNEQQLSGKVIIGSNNVIREYVSIHSPERKEVTSIGDHCYIMNKVHVGHDCVIEDHVIISALSSTGGVVNIKKYANLGQGVIVRGRLTIGENAMIGCGAAVIRDVPDFQTWAGTPAKFLKYNIRGMEKRDFTEKEINNIILVEL